MIFANVEHDIDALLLRGDLSALRQAVKAVATEYELAEDWLNDAVKGFADILPPDFYQRLVLLPFPGRCLRLYALGRPEQTALKIWRISNSSCLRFQMRIKRFCSRLCNTLIHSGLIGP